MAIGFSGNFTIREDDKHRILIPVNFRPLLAVVENDTRIEKIILTKNTGETILGYPEAEFGKLKQQIESLSSRSPEGRLVRHIFLSQSFEMVLDKQGRIVIPKPLREHAKINGEAVIAGIGNKFEIWSKEKWDSYQELIERDYKAALEAKSDDVVSYLGEKYELI
ncbi:MAG: division/cell wall cluster transcriptional repressor MraZ [Myxococcota bacterium]